MQVVEGKGDLLGLIRDDLPVRGAAYKMARMAGPGKSPYTQYDREIAARAQIWLREEAQKYRDKPWVLFVSFVAPHYPLTAPPEHFYRYFDDPKLPMPLFYDRRDRPDHPFVRDYATAFNFDDYLREPRPTFAGRSPAISGSAASWTSRPARCSMRFGFGFGADTRIVYTSDHGDAVGKRGLWGKSTLYEETAGCR